MKTLKSILQRLNNRGTVISLVALIISLVAQFGVDIDSQKVLGIVQTVCSILILLGVLNDPTQNAKGYLPGVCDKLIDNIKE